jgi:hypothetical protein
MKYPRYSPFLFNQIIVVDMVNPAKPEKSKTS